MDVAVSCNCDEKNRYQKAEEWKKGKGIDR